MNQVMHHPKYGTKIATHEQEVKNDEKEGWVKYVFPQTFIEAPEVVNEAPVNVLARRGRKPKEVN